MDFGFTNYEAQYRRVKAWKEAAVADGWSIEPTYPPQGQNAGESVERAARLHRDGWTVQILTRDNQDDPGRKWKYEAQVSVWDADGRGVTPGDTYDPNHLKESSMRCDGCGKLVEKVHPVAFANKACSECLPNMRREMEKPGWCD